MSRLGGLELVEQPQAGLHLAPHALAAEVTAPGRTLEEKARRLARALEGSAPGRSRASR